MVHRAVYFTQLSYRHVMDVSDRLKRAVLHSVLGAGVGGVVWLTADYVRGQPLDYAGAITFAVTFCVVMFGLRLWRG